MFEIPSQEQSSRRKSYCWNRHPELGRPAPARNVVRVEDSFGKKRLMKAPTHTLTPELCRTFVAIERCGGSLTAAAIELNDDKANLSKRIRPLVHGSPPHLPRPWLYKEGKKFRLTEEGRTMLGPARELLDRWQNFVVFAHTSRLSGLTIACGQEAAGGVVLEAATRFRKLRPEATLTIAVVRGGRRIEGLANGLYDVALVTTTRPEVEQLARRPVTVEPLAEDELLVACAAKSVWSSAFASDRPVTVAELTPWPLVLPETDSALRRQFDERLRRQNVLPQVAIAVGGWHVAARYVLAGFGVGVLPKSVVAEAGPRLRSRPLDAKLRPVNRLNVVTLTTPVNAALVQDFLTAFR
jgi:DNA-binding transcriptional LysR family regulator